MEVDGSGTLKEFEGRASDHCTWTVSWARNRVNVVAPPPHPPQQLEGWGCRQQQWGVAEPGAGCERVRSSAPGRRV